MPDAIKQDGSGDYTTIQGWADAVAAGTAFDGVGEIQDSNAYDEDVSISSNGGGYSEIRLTVAAANRHDGTAGSGARIVRSGASAGQVVQLDIESTLEWLEVDGADQGADTLVSLNDDSFQGCVVQDCVIHGISFTGGANCRGLTTTSNGEDRIYRCVVYDIKRPTTNRNAVAIADDGASSRARTFLGNTVDNVVHNAGSARAISFNDESNRTIRNNVATRSDGNAFATSTSNVVANNNASDDATAPGTSSLTSITPGDQYTSLTGGSEDYHLKSGADCIDAGADLGATANIDIDGRDVDAEGDTWDIGADEFVDSGGASVGQVNVFNSGVFGSVFR